MHTLTRRRAWAAAALAASALALLGCGGGDTASTPLDTLSTPPTNESSTHWLPDGGQIERRHLVALQLTNGHGAPLDVVVRLTARRTLRVTEGGPAMVASAIVASGATTVSAQGLPHAATAEGPTSWQECTALLYHLGAGQALQSTAWSVISGPAGTAVALEDTAMVITAEAYAPGDAPADGGCQ